MAKRNFPKFQHHSSQSDGLNFKWSQDMDQTAELPDLSEEPEITSTETSDPLDSYVESYRKTVDPENPSAMPHADFRSMTHEDLTDLSWLDIPELGSLELENKLPDDLSSVPTEEEAIEEAFQQTAEKKKVKPPRRKRSSGARKHSGKTLGILISSLVLTAVLVCALGFLYPRLVDPYGRRILNGVTIAGVDVGGLSRKDALTLVSAEVLPALSENDMVITLPEKTVTLSSKDAGVKLDVKSAVRDAYRYGRSGSAQEKEEAYRASMTQNYAVDLLPYLTVNDNYIQGQLKTYSLEHKSEFIQSSYALEGDRPPLDFKKFHKDNTCQTLLLSLGTPDAALDYNRVREPILSAYASLQFQLSLTPEQTGTLPAPLDLAKILSEVTIEPVDSQLDLKTFEVISGSYGYTFDLKSAQALLDQAHYGETVRIPMIYVSPEIMDKDVLFQDVLGQAETPYGNNPRRTINMRLACEAINGTVLRPGDEFSFNEALGQRTAEKGYQPAPAYSGNKLVDSLGGGICQVSSTLYYSSLLADMEITDRINHGFVSSYIAPGLDATVSWGKPDFKFVNSSDLPIKIKAEVLDGIVRVQILGTDNRDYYVKIESEDSVTAHGTTYEDHAYGGEYDDGEVIRAGVDGHYVKTFRCKYSKETDALLSREEEAISNYPAHTEIVASVEKPEPTEEPEPPQPEETQPPQVPQETETPQEVFPEENVDQPEEVPQADQNSSQDSENTASIE